MLVACLEWQVHTKKLLCVTSMYNDSHEWLQVLSRPSVSDASYAGPILYVSGSKSLD